jgi:hypothetical protein
MSVTIFKTLDPKTFEFSKPFKQDKFMRIAVTPRMFVQTNGIEILSVDMPGDVIKFRVNKALAKFLTSVDARVLEHAKTHKDSMFSEGVADDLIESQYVSPLTDDGATFQARLSKELVVYDSENAVVSPNSLKPGAKVIAIMTPSFVDFSRSKFTCRWSVMAIREKKSNQDVI